MHCLQCGAEWNFEYAGPNKEYARCTRCLALHNHVQPKGHHNYVTLLDVRAPNGQVDPQFTAMYAQQLGFAPRQAQDQVVGVGPVNLVIPTARIERDIRNRISGFIWGWVITGIVLVLVAIGGLVLYFYVRGQMNAEAANGGMPVAGNGAPVVASWDGKSEYSCGASQVVVIKNVTATLTSGTAVNVLGACQLTLDNVNITAPDGIQAMGTAKVTVKGGSIKSTGTAISAMGNAQVDVQGAKITGKTSTLGAGAKITGAK
ncbi:MAG TPA: hypothetical protein VIF09_17560 [Polyangiaceae bacterium]|jgi:phage baseplate assembly protein gpV